MSKIQPILKSNKMGTLSDHVTPWLFFRDAEQADNFYKFKYGQSNLFVFFALQLAATVFNVLNTWSAWEYFPSALTTFNFVITVAFAIISGWILLALRIMKSQNKVLRCSCIRMDILIQYLESLWLLGHCISIGVGIVVIGYNGHCNTHDYFASQGCSNIEGHLHEWYVLLSVFFPGMCSLVMSPRWEFVIGSFLMNIFLVLLTMSYFGFQDSIPSFCSFLPLFAVMMYENQRQNISVFLLTQSQRNLLQENERLAAETHATELRSMIGNVAHDLKTPLSAFMSGIELINSYIEEANEKQWNEGPERQSAWQCAKDGVQNMKNVNDFMLMTINRCIDYTKASQGLKLVPRLETISFLESINLPLSCMKNLQESKIEIKLLPVSGEICSHIITDKQWLQENILCLLSNAVKYSTGGTVSITATLQNVETSQSVRLITPVISAPHVRIEVQDTGIGISEETMKNLFNPFKQAQRLAGGTGLGLYSLAKRIEALGGTYGVKARTDISGSVFWFTIPYRPDNSAALMIGVSSTTGFNTPLSGSRDDGDVSARPRRLPPLIKTIKSQSESNIPSMVIPSPVEKKVLNILLVDDSLSILKMSSMMLRRQGHSITTAENGAEALQKVTDQYIAAQDKKEPNLAFDVVLMDLQMPIMDGLESTCRIRKMEASIEAQTRFHSARVNSCDSFRSRNLFVREDTAETTPNENSLRFVTQKAHQLIIGVSANSDNETMEAAFAAGIDAFIPKPFNMQSFNDTYKSSLARLQR